MTIEFRQDMLDGRRLTIFSSANKPASSLAPQTPSITTSTKRDQSNASMYGQPVVDDSLDDGWKRVLYQHNPKFPDNYTPPSFLSSLSINGDINIYEYLPSVKSTLIAVVLPVCLIPVFFLVYVKLDEGILTPSYMFIVNVAVLVAGYICREKLVQFLLESQPVNEDTVAMFSPHPTGGGDPYSNPPSASKENTLHPSSSCRPPWSVTSIDSVSQWEEKWRSPKLNNSVTSTTLGSKSMPQPPPSSLFKTVLKDVYHGTLVFGTVFVLSPLLRSLTHSWSTASIFSIGIAMLIVHVIFHDYGFISQQKTQLELWQQLRGNRERLIRSWKRVDKSLALNAIIFSAIVLASRLGTAEAVFAFLFFSMTAFPFLPFVTKLLYLSDPDTFVFRVAPGMILLTTLALLVNSYILALVFLGCVAGVVLICPYLLILCLPLKNAIKGPWDIAHVRISNANLPTTPVGTALLNAESRKLK